ncbi:MAG: hypothetical protein BK997_02940 [Candidatus Micrarchaeum sp. ARMAN-1]|nr:MAG: hypothetical protein BK997_02940 [Candidatus Micrarchaeum sp. ARMAN-1]
MRKYAMMAVLGFVFLLMVSGISGASPTNASCTNPNTVTSFNIVSVKWGLPSSQNLQQNQSLQVSSVSAGPGQKDVPLTVTLDNNNNCELVDVQAQMPLVSYFTAQNGTPLYAVDNIQNVQPYSFFNVVYYLNIANNTPVGPNGGTYEKLNLYWNYTNSNEGYEYSTQFLVPLKGSTELYFNTTQQLTAGRVDYITLNVSNKGSGYGYAIKPSVESTSYVSQAGPATSISTLTPNSTAEVSIPVYVSPSAASTTVPVTFEVSYINAYGYNETTPVTFGMYAVPPANKVSIGLSSNEITIGQLQNDSLEIINNDSSPISNVSLTLTATSPLTLIGSDGYYSIGSIAAMKSDSIPVSLYITSQTDVATLDAQLSYVLNGQPYSVSRSLSLLSPGYVNITNTGTTQLPDVATPGSVVSLTGTLLNTGSISASAVTLITHSISGVSVLGENSTFLGSIGTYSPTAFTVSVTLSKGIKPGTYEIPITLEYINNLNQKENELIDMPLVVSSGNSTAFSSNPYANAAKYRKSSGALLYIILAVVIIAIASVMVYKKKSAKKGKKQSK